MENILLVFLNNLKDEEGFNRIIDEFDKRDYRMYLYDSIRDTDFDFSELPNIIEYYKELHKDINKLVILSNMRDLVFAWYRCYNSIVDDFIYFIDEEESDFFTVEHKHYTFFNNLSEFNGIEQETVEGKIYVNMDFFNYYKLIYFLIKDNNLKYFDSFNNFDFSSNYKRNKKNISKKYIFKRYEYSFDIVNVGEIEKIYMSMTNNKELNIRDNFIKEVCDNTYIIPYLTVLFYKTGESVFTNLLLAIYKCLKGTDNQKQKEVFDCVFMYINNDKLDFREKIYISSLLVLINSGSAKLTEFIMKTLIEDEKYFEYHYEIVANILFYRSSENLAEHNNYYLDLKTEISRIASWVSKDMKMKDFKRKNNSKKIAILVDQLLSIRHSPTKLMLDYAKSIKKYYPEYEVRIFVEDNLYCSNEEKLIPYLYSSGVSELCKKEHNDYLNDERIEVIYCNVKISKKYRTFHLIKEINEFGPQAILTNSDISITANLFYEKLPIIFLSMGGNYFSNKANVYLCGNKNTVVEYNRKYNLLEENRIYDFKYGLEFKESNKIIKREDLGLKEEDFIMVTVGNRLDAEMDEEFIDYIMTFVMKNRDVKWIIVGSKCVKYLEEKYSSLIGEKVIIIKYESDLPALYRICDVYVNPRRTGGGISIAMAMNEGLPVVLTMNSTDGVIYTGIENASGGSMEDYILDLNKVYVDKQYANEKRKVSTHRIKEFKMETSVDCLVHIFKNV